MTRPRTTALLPLIVGISLGLTTGLPARAQVSDEEALTLVRAAERTRIETIRRVIGSVVAIYGEDRQGGGSGVIIDPSGLALTNHHVIQGAGTEGWGGIDDGKLYRWSVIGTDPGGDIALIQLEGRDDFPYSRLGDSDQVRVGDWAMAMGNPFILSEDETPTVTLGIVSGVNRFQEGAGTNQLVYGNCIQVDSSINPGNSGGPLFNMAGEVIGINGRGSFEARGRVNVGLGYAISANQIKQFVPDLLATKLVQHGTPDATFNLRGGKIVCDSMEQDCEARKLGLELEDELLEFEDVPIATVNQYLNLLCTLPEGWPAKFRIRKTDQRELTLYVRLYGLPYNIQSPPDQPKPEEPTPEQKKALERQQKMMALLTTPAATIRDPDRNRQSLEWLLAHWQRTLDASALADSAIVILDDVKRGDETIGTQRIVLDRSGRFRVEWNERGQKATFGFDGQSFWRHSAAGTKILSIVEAKLTPQITQVVAIASQHPGGPLAILGTPLLDGGDKANGQLSCRVKILDENEDWLYCWFSLFDETSRWQVHPVKIAGDLDADGSAPAVCLGDWRTNGPLAIPYERRWVRGRDEATEIRIETTAVDSLASVEPDDFTPPPSAAVGDSDMRRP